MKAVTVSWVRVVVAGVRRLLQDFGIPSQESAIDGYIAGESAPSRAEEMASAVQLDSDAKVNALLALIAVFHNNINVWISQSYTVALWAVGIEFTVVGYVLVNGADLSPRQRVVVSALILLFGLFIQAFLRRAARAHYGNRLAIAKCEAALRLYEPGQYLAERSFFTFSRKALLSRNFSFLISFHLLVTIICAALVFFGDRFQ